MTQTRTGNEGKKEFGLDAQTEIREQRQGAGNVESMERKGKAEGGRVRRMERFDLDVWLQQPTRARDRDMRAKENDRRGGGGGG